MPAVVLRRLGCIVPLLAVLTIIAHAQPLEPCVPDCPETPWEGSLIGHSTDISCGSNTCHVTIWYRKRTACGYLHDISIVGIEKDFNHPGCEDLCSFDDLMQECTKALLLSNSTGFPPRVDEIGCFETWRISSATCWHLDLGDLLNPHPAYYACVDMCCLARYRVCQDVHNNRTYELLDSYNPEIMPVCEAPCFLTCAVALPPYPKSVSRDPEREKSMSHPNPAHSSVSIPYSISRDGRVVAIIRDINGNEVVRSGGDDRSTGSWAIAVDVSGLAAGTYLYTIECDGRQVANGPLTIAW